MDNGDLAVTGLFSRVDEASTWGFARWDGIRWVDQDESPINYLAQSVRSGDTWWINGWYTNMLGVLESALLEKREGRWRPLLVQPHTTGAIRAMVSDGKGLYIGGRFREVGDQAITNIAYWDGTPWNPVGGGIQQYRFPINDGFYEAGYVTAMAMDGANLYVGGNFQTAGSVATRNIARWDGMNWHPLRGGVTIYATNRGPYGLQAEVTSILPDAGRIYVGGGFNFVDGQPMSGLAQWDGTQWATLGDSRLEFDASVSAIKRVGGLIFISAGFTSISGQPVRGFAKWDGSKWTPLSSGGPGVGWSVRILAASDTALALGVRPSFQFGFGEHNGLALYHVPPRLSVERLPAGLRIQWPGPAWHYWLEHSPSLAEGSWTLGPMPQEGSGTIRFVDLPMAPNQAASFLRLRRIPELRR